jgi:hypothetical protein
MHGYAKINRQAKEIAAMNFLKQSFAARVYILAMSIVCLPGSLPKLRCFAAEEATAAEKAKASQKLLDEFQRIYELPNGKAIKRVAPPFSPERMEYYRVHHAEQAKHIPEGPEYMCFQQTVVEPGAEVGRFQLGKLHWKSMGWAGGGGVEIVSLIDSFTGIESNEMQGDKTLTRTKVTGDWVTRHGASAEELLAELETILRQECKVPVRFKLVHKFRKVIIAEGEYAYRALPGNESYEDDIGVQWDRIDIYESDRSKLREEAGRKLDDVFSAVGKFIGRPILNEATRLPKNSVCWRWSAHRFNEAQERGDVDADAILEHLSEQTGLKFSEAYRKGRVLLVERAE